MGIHRFFFYAVALAFFVGFCLVIPKEFDLLSLIKMENLTNFLLALLLLSAYLALMTLFSVTKVKFLEVGIIILLSFVIATLTIELPYSLATFFIILYCYKVKENTNLLRKPNPGFSSATTLPYIFFLLSFFIAAIMFLTMTPSFRPEDFVGLDSFVEASIGCKADQILDDCVKDIVEKQTQYSDLLKECEKYPAQKAACVSQTNAQYTQILNQTKSKYGKVVPLNSTVSVFFRYMASDEINNWAQGNKTIFKIFFAVTAFSLISSVGGFVNIIVASIASILLSLMIFLGVIKELPSTEEVTDYYLE